MSWTSSQDGGVGRNPLLPHTTKRRITTNLKSINNQKCQKIKLYGTLDNQGIKEKINQNNQTDATRQRNRAQMKEHSKTSERELSEEEIAYLCDGEFKALVIKMFTDLIEVGHK